MAGEEGPQLGDARIGLSGLGAREHDAHVEVLVGGDQLVRAGQVRLGQNQDRIEARLVGGDQTAVDHAGARRRIRQRHDDAHRVRVRDDRLLAALIRRVLEGTAQHRGAFLDGDDARERVGAPGQVAGQAHAVAHDDGAAAQLAGAYGDHAGPVRLQAHLVAATVDTDDATQRLGGPVRPVLRARARALAGAHAHARVVGSGVAAGHHCSSPIDEAGAAGVLP